MVKPVFAPQIKNPKYPFLSSTEPEALVDYFSARNILRPGERIKRVSAASARARNTVLRISTSERSLVLKQFRDWPDNGRHAPSVRERFQAECLFHDAGRVDRRLGGALPGQLHCDARAGCVVFSDAGVRSTRSPTLSTADTRALAWFLISLHHHSQSLPARARYRSDDLVQWQVQRLFGRFSAKDSSDVPGPLDKALTSSLVLRRALRDAKDALLAEGTSLVHGDFLPWNWAGKTGSLKVIDAECSFYGCPELDAGAFLAGLLLSKQSGAAVNEGIKVLTDGCVRYDPRLMAAFAAAHMCALLAGQSVDKGLARGNEAIALLDCAIRAIKEGTVRPFSLERTKLR